MEVIAYHGTCKNFTRFDAQHGGSNTGKNEVGAFYFSNDIDIAEDYSRQGYRYKIEDAMYWAKKKGKIDCDKEQKILDKIESKLIVKEAKLTFKNPLILDNREGKYRPTDYDFLVTWFRDNQPDFSLGSKIYEEILVDIYDKLEFDEDVISDNIEEIEKYALEYYEKEYKDLEGDNKKSCIKECLSDLGYNEEFPEYDGIIIENTCDAMSEAYGYEQTVYIAFHEWQIQILNQNFLKREPKENNSKTINLELY